MMVSPCLHSVSYLIIIHPHGTYIASLYAHIVEMTNVFIKREDILAINKHIK